MKLPELVQELVKQYFYCGLSLGFAVILILAGIITSKWTYNFLGFVGIVFSVFHVWQGINLKKEVLKNGI